MTFSVSLALLLGKRIEMQRQIVMQDVLDQDTLANVRNFIIFIIKMTFIFEIIGAIALFISWKGRFTGNFITAYHAIFHSVSAFCNAGFSTFSDNLIRFSGDSSTNVTICFLIILGGLGFTVIKDLWDNIKNRFFSKNKKIIRLKVQTKIVFVISILLIVAGALFFYLIETNNSLSQSGLKNKILVSLFQSVTARTAGFNTSDMAGLSTASLLLMIVLMFIGGSPGSTAGGIKTTTIAVLWATITSGFRQKDQVELYRRTIPYEVVRKAISVFIISLFVLFVFSMLLLYAEKKMFVSVLFEAVSAFGTVGLSTGITGQLTEKGKLIITLLMFIGRLGPLTIAYAFLSSKRPVKYTYAEERVMIG